MKKLFLITLLLIGMSIISCQKQTNANTEEPTELSVSPTEFVLGGGDALMGYKAEIRITTNKAWTAATSGDARCFLAPASGGPGTSSLFFSLNGYLKERSFEIIITAGELSKSVKVKLLANKWDGSEEDYPLVP